MSFSAPAERLAFLDLAMDETNLSMDEARQKRQLSSPTGPDEKRSHTDNESVDPWTELASMRRSMDGMKDSLFARMDAMEKQLQCTMTAMFQNFRDEFHARIEDLENRMACFEERLESRPPASTPPYDPENTIIANGVVQDENEDVMQKAKEIVQDGLGLDSTTVVRATRVPSRGTQPGLMKIEFPDVNTKVTALRAKQRLQNYDENGRIFIRSAKSHVERIIEINFRMLLKELPNGNQFRITSNGRLVRKDDPPNMHGPDSANYGGGASSNRK